MLSTTVGMLKGTMLYLSPVAMQGATSGSSYERAVSDDLWSACLVILEMDTGVPIHQLFKDAGLSIHDFRKFTVTSFVLKLCLARWCCGCPRRRPLGRRRCNFGVSMRSESKFCGWYVIGIVWMSVELGVGYIFRLGSQVLSLCCSTFVWNPQWRLHRNLQSLQVSKIF
jgi:hypothetical protein